MKVGLTMQIKAAVLRSTDGEYQIENVDLMAPGPGEILVRIVGVGFCHTDVLPRVPGAVPALPLIAGHEGSGVVEATGAGVTEVEIGDHVVLSYDSCGECASCQSSQTAYCETFLPRNLTGFNLDGTTPVRDEDGHPVAARWFGQSSFATHSVVAVRNVVKVDPELPLEILGPLGCGIQTGAGSVLVALDVTAASSIVVFGAGAVGLSAVMAARVAAATTIIAVDLNPERLDLARELGATHTLNARQGDILEQLSNLTNGGADYSFDTTGVPAVIDNAIRAVRLGGTCGLVGIQQGDLVLDPTALVGRNVKAILEGGAVPKVFIPQLIALWKSGNFPFDKLIKTFPLEKINDAEHASASGDVVKPVLIPSREVAIS